MIYKILQSEDLKNVRGGKSHDQNNQSSLLSCFLSAFKNC